MNTYTVRAGDSLFLIAKQFYGDGSLYAPLAAYNQIDNPNALEVGTVLNIPPQAQLQSGQSALSDWHHYGSGSIHWRVTDQGVEIRGKGRPATAASRKQVQRIWTAYEQPIRAASEQHQVPIPVILATIATESSGNADAYRYEPAFYRRYLKDKAPWTQNPYYGDPERISASYGLMQIMYTTAYNAGFRGKPEDLYDPATGIDAGTAYIASAPQRRQHQWDPPKIACAYNAGSVRPTKKNAWGMHYHPGHLDRWIPAYNSAVALVGAAPVAAGSSPEPATEPAAPEPAPTQPAAPSTATLTLMFPKPADGAWSPLVVDMFRHTDHGLETPQSITITAPSGDADGAYVHEIPGILPGVYDLVLADAAGGALVYDAADVQIASPAARLDIRRTRPATASASAPERVNVEFTFAAVPGQAWRPMIIDAYRHTPSGDLAEPVSYTVKIPSHSSDGGYLYQISQLEPGTYDFVFTDAATSSVLQDVAGYVVDEHPERIDLRNTRGLYAPPDDEPETQRDTTLTSLWHSFLSIFSRK